jgi:hypothetical protein
MKRPLLTVFAILCIYLSPAQSPTGLSNRAFFVGGSLGSTFSNSLINLSPKIGYRFNRFVDVGFGINGTYQNLRDIDETTGALFSREQRIILGLDAFARFYPCRNFMVQVQPEGNYMFGNISFYDTNPKETYKIDTQIIPSIMVGGGFVYPVSHGQWTASALYDMLQYNNTPYAKKVVISVGYNTNF